MFDLVIEGGWLIDGTGSPRSRADIGIRADRITQVGDLAGMNSAARFDAHGKIVAPGFIDAHTHDDSLLLLPPPSGLHPKLSQGVTTVITGNCGISRAPLQADSPPPPLDLLGKGGWTFDRFDSYLCALERAGPSVNAACLVGHSTLRVKHMASLNRVATPKEAAAMAADLADALRAGAIGLSTGLFYPPAAAADADEVVAVGAALKGSTAIIAMHIRDEGDRIVEALDEALDIGRRLAVKAVLSHHKVAGKANHGRSRETLAMITEAALHQSVCLDCYPYNASSTMLMPARVEESSDVLVTWSQAEPAAAGRSLFKLARERGQTPQELACALQPGGAIYFAMSEDDVEAILRHPLSMIGSDGLPHDVHPHPRLWGTFAKVLGHYVRERRLFTLETAVHKMTALSARRFGLVDRGTLAPGSFADIVVFDEHAIADLASFHRPTETSVGIDAVFVNGQLAQRDGRTQNTRAGRVLRHGGAAR